jgi:hypothetical protein
LVPIFCVHPSRTSVEGAGGRVRLQAPALAQLLAPQMASNIGPMGSACARRSG